MLTVLLCRCSRIGFLQEIEGAYGAKRALAIKVKTQQTARAVRLFTRATGEKLNSCKPSQVLHIDSKSGKTTREGMNGI